MHLKHQAAMRRAAQAGEDLLLADKVLLQAGRSNYTLVHPADGKLLGYLCTKHYRYTASSSNNRNITADAAATEARQHNATQLCFN
mmetsp:Transcript_51136/g.121519  ORF Transcript_51136/g.121519 Transcript_51136/m.121519 type:complete len:86 (-) Transcript_51136:38-295(-)